MLIQKSKKYDKGDVISLRLITGEEMVGRLEEETATEFVLEKALSLGQGPEGIGFTSCMITAAPKIGFSVQKIHVMLHTATREEFAKVYTEATTSIKLL